MSPNRESSAITDTVAAEAVVLPDFAPASVEELTAFRHEFQGDDKREMRAGVSAVIGQQTALLRYKNELAEHPELLTLFTAECAVLEAHELDELLREGAIRGDAVALNEASLTRYRLARLEYFEQMKKIYGRPH